MAVSSTPRRPELPDDPGNTPKQILVELLDLFVKNSHNESHDDKEIAQDSPVTALHTLYCLTVPQCLQ